MRVAPEFVEDATHSRPTFVSRSARLNEPSRIQASARSSKTSARATGSSPRRRVAGLYASIAPLKNVVWSVSQ